MPKKKERSCCEFQRSENRKLKAEVRQLRKQLKKIDWDSPIEDPQATFEEPEDTRWSLKCVKCNSGDTIYTQVGTRAIFKCTSCGYSKSESKKEKKV